MSDLKQKLVDLKRELDELRAQPIPKKPRPKPAAEVIPGPWPRRVRTEQEIIEYQRLIDWYWERNLARWAEQSAEPSPERKLNDWIYGRNR
jgi:hypothetical protein